MTCSTSHVVCFHSAFKVTPNVGSIVVSQTEMTTKKNYISGHLCKALLPAEHATNSVHVLMKTALFWPIWAQVASTRSREPFSRSAPPSSFPMPSCMP